MNAPVRRTPRAPGAGTPHQALAALVSPLAVDRFLDEVWEERPGLFDCHPALRGLFCAADLPALLAMRHDPAAAPLWMGRMKEGRFERRLPYRDPQTLDPEAVERGWRAGRSLIVPELHGRWPPLGDLCDLLAAQSCLRAEVNLYYTPAGAAAFPPHYDTHDVFVLQAFGEKEWRLYPSPRRLPIPDERYATDDPRNRRDLAVPARVLRLAVGKVLYLPRGVVHEAVSRDLPSLHLSIGIYPLLWRDVLIEAGLDDATGHPALRRAIPLGLLRDPDPEALAAAAREAVPLPPDAIAAMVRRLRARLKAAPEGSRAPA